jgi:hypothetical protein
MKLCQDAVKQYKAFFSLNMQAAVTMKRVDDLRQQIMQQGNMRKGLTMLQNAYNEFDAKGTIQGVAVPPDARQSVKGRKLWQDELRFVIYEALRSVCLTPAYNPQNFMKITDDLRTTRAGNNYENEVAFNDIAHDVAPRERLTFVAAFINSTDFLYSPPPEAIVGNWGEPRAMPLSGRGVYNRNACALAGLNAIGGMVYPGGLSPHAKEEETLRKELYGN